MILAQGDPTQAGNVVVDVPETRGFMAVFNDSDYSLFLSTGAIGASGAYLPARQHRNVPLYGASVKLAWNNPTLTTPKPIGPQVLVFEIYGMSELATNPLASLTSSNLANTGSSNVSSDSIKNDGNPAGTIIVEATQAGAASSSTVIGNDGIMLLAVMIASSLVNVLQTSNVDPVVKLGALTHMVDVLGNLEVQGTTSLDAGAITTDGAGALTATSLHGPLTGNASTATTATTATNANALNSGANVPGGKLGKSVDGDILDASGATTAIHSSGATNPVSIDAPGGINSTSGYFSRSGVNGDLIDASGTGVYLKGSGAGLLYQYPNGTTRWTRSQESTFTGSGSGTFNHNCGGTPTHVFAICSVASSSETVGSANFNASQCQITCGASIAFRAMAIRF